MSEFQSLPWLYLKQWIVLGVCAIAAMGFLDTGPRLPAGTGRNAAALCLSLILGVTGLVFTSYLALRFMLLIELPHPFAASVGVSGAVVLLGVVLFLCRVARRWRSPAQGVARSPQPGARVSAIVLALAAMGMLPLLPLALSPDIVFYAGAGTDATGYVRAARSMLEGWYFETIPHSTFRDVLYHTDRAWTYRLIELNDRPLAFYLIALVAALCRVNPFQAYLMSESLALILLSAFALFLVFAFSRFHGLLRATAALFALGLVMQAGLIGDLFRQFLGHAWSIVTGTVLAPAVLWVCLFASRPAWSLPRGAFAVALIAIGVYDVRFALFTLAVSLGAWALLPAPGWRSRAGVAALMILALVGASVVGGSADKDLRSLRGFNVNQFPEARLSLDVFLVRAGLDLTPSAWSRGLWVALSAAILLGQGVAFGKDLKLRQDSPSLCGDGFRFLSNYMFLLHLGSLLAAAALAGIGNDWAAHKLLFWVAGAQALGGTLWLVSMGNRRKFALGLAAGLVAVACALMAARTTWQNAQAVVETPRAHGVIARRGLLEVGRQLERARPDVVWFEGRVLDWLVFYSLFPDGRWAALAPYPLWYHGVGLFGRLRELGDSDAVHPPGLPEDAALKRLYAETLGRPEVQHAGSILAVVSEDATATGPQATCGQPYCVVPIALDELMLRAAESAR